MLFQSASYKEKYDIFICGGSEHFTELKALLPLLSPYGRLHLASITLTGFELSKLQGHYDVLHEPAYDTDGYKNFNLFCIRDINRAARAPYFIKIDADVLVREDWIDYVDNAVLQHHDLVLLGPGQGSTGVNLELCGSLVRKKLGSAICVRNGAKVKGHFYVGKTAFFKAGERFMQHVHELLYCFKDGIRCRAPTVPQEWPAADESVPGAVGVGGDCEKDYHENPIEDALRSLVVHALGAGDLLRVVEDGGRISLCSR
jgi:hypothetical protein